jgi:multidrug resistance efflux pump
MRGGTPEQIAAQRSRALAAEAETHRAAAALEQAQLNLQYTTIVAPVSGIVGQRSVQPGQNVSPPATDDQGGPAHRGSRQRPGKRDT